MDDRPTDRPTDEALEQIKSPLPPPYQPPSTVNRHFGGENDGLRRLPAIIQPLPRNGRTFLLGGGPRWKRGGSQAIGDEIDQGETPRGKKYEV